MWAFLFVSLWLFLFVYPELLTFADWNLSLPHSIVTCYVWVSIQFIAMVTRVDSSRSVRVPLHIHWSILRWWQLGAGNSCGYNLYKKQKTLNRIDSDSNQWNCTQTSVWMAQHTTESRWPRLVHTYISTSLGYLDSAHSWFWLIAHHACARGHTVVTSNIYSEPIRYSEGPNKF